MSDPNPIVSTSKAYSATIAVAITTILVWAVKQFGHVDIPDYVQGSVVVIAAALGDRFFPGV